jgi:hypothetical protein
MNSLVGAFVSTASPVMVVSIDLLSAPQFLKTVAKRRQEGTME